MVAAAASVAACGGPGASSAPAAAQGHTSNAGATSAPPAPPPPLLVTAISPHSGDLTVEPDSTITVTFSRPVATAATPTLKPAVAGTWTRTSATSYSFSPAAALPLDQPLTVTVPAGQAGVRALDGGKLVKPVTATLQVADGSTLRLEELLAQLGYLPLSFTPHQAVPLTAAAQAAAAISAPAGSFAWRWSTLPLSLTSLWAQGSPNTILRGAIMAFENQEGLAVDGDAGPQVWAALIKATLADQHDAQPYSYVYVSKDLPERATVYQDGKVVYSTLANTGIPQAPTADGTYPVYERYTVTTMTGLNPDGTKYSDPGIPWVSYFNGGDALHGFIRKSYGFEQSLGCVEMPYANADVVWHDVDYGTLVTVAGP